MRLIRLVCDRNEENSRVTRTQSSHLHLQSLAIIVIHIQFLHIDIVESTHIQRNSITTFSNEARPTNRAKAMLERLLVELVDGQVLEGAFGPGYVCDGDEGEEVAVPFADAAVAA